MNNFSLTNGSNHYITGWCIGKCYLLTLLRFLIFKVLLMVVDIGTDVYAGSIRYCGFNTNLLTDKFFRLHPLSSRTSKMGIFDNWNNVFTHFVDFHQQLVQTAEVYIKIFFWFATSPTCPSFEVFLVWFFCLSEYWDLTSWCHKRLKIYMQRVFYVNNLTP